MSRHLLVDSRATLEAARESLGGALHAGLTVVATTAAGMLACEQAHVSYVTIDSYSSREELIELGWDNYSRLDSFCAHWDVSAQQAAPCLRERGIKPFRFGYYDFKILLDTLSVKCLLLANFVDRAGSRDVIFARNREREVGCGEPLRPRADADIAPIMLEALFAQKSHLNPLPAPVCARAAHLHRRRRSLLGLARAARNRLKALLPQISDGPARNFLLFNSGHDISYVLPHLRQRGFQPMHIPARSASATEDARNGCMKLWGLLSGDKDFKNLFTCRGLDFFALVEPLIGRYIQAELPRAIAYYDQVRGHLGRHPVAFALTGTINLGLMQRCGMLAAQACGAPLITYTEGAGYGSIISPIYDHTEVCDGDLMLCYGEGNLEYYRDRGGVSRKLVEVGSAHQQAVRLACRGMTAPAVIRTVMYVGTVVFDNIVHLPNCGLISTTYFASQLRMYRLLASLPQETRVVAKPNPSDPNFRYALKLAGLRRIGLETRPFENALKGVDLFIIDYPSTVLLTAISTRAYVFVLVEKGVSGFTSKQRIRLEKRAYVFDRFEDLQQAVRGILSDPRAYPPRLGDDYMAAYSVCDGSSAERAADAIGRCLETLA